MLIVLSTSYSQLQSLPMIIMVVGDCTCRWISVNPLIIRESACFATRLPIFAGA